MSRILIVEDEESIAELEKDYQELSGFEVEIENDGESGLKRALEEEFDLFILDLMLPGVDGFEICKRIRENKNTPIIMVSAKKDDIDKIKFLGSKILFLPVYIDPSGRFVDLKAPDLDDIVGRHSAADEALIPGHMGLYPGHHLAGAEGLCDIIVSSVLIAF